MDLGALFDLTGKTAIVTGGSSGLGEAISKGLLRFGAKVGILDLNPPGPDLPVGNCGASPQFASCDVTDPARIASAVDRVETLLGPVSILVNCAGTVKGAPAEDMPDEWWDRILKVNLYGTFYVCRETGRRMIAHGGGSIVNMASQAGVIGLPRGNTNYGASKGAIIALTRTLAVEWAKHRIRVNSISPCHFNTPLTRELIEDPEIGKSILSRIPLGRVGEVQDIVGPVIFLASAASAMVTGHNLMVDGGVTASY
jgi:NAD(P)-dependent dehydrogenase (short-subunit alcohol dehydrogenase family)